MADRRFRALLIGNWDYQDPDSTLRALKGPKNDVSALRESLTDGDYGLFDRDDVIVLENLKGLELNRCLYETINEASSQDMLLIYYSGHGERVSQQRLGLCGVELAYSKRETDCFKTSELSTWIKDRNRAQSTVVVLDCCFSGAYKGTTITEDDLAASFGEGTIVLASGGSQAIPDAVDDDALSPFTEALVAALVDPNLAGDEHGWVSPQKVYDRLLSHTPALVPQPKLQGSVKGRVALARRPRPTSPQIQPLKGWVDDQQFEMVDISFSLTGVIATLVDAETDKSDLEVLDAPLRHAVRLLGELADHVAGSKSLEARQRVRTLERTWECVGVNLARALPPAARRRLSDSDQTGKSVVSIRLRFDEDGDDLEAMPWERLHLGEHDVGDTRPLALQRGVTVLRASPPSETTRATPSAVVVNAYEGALGTGGHATSRQLDDRPGLPLFKDLHGREATWAGFVDALDQRPRYLVVCAPVRAREAPEVGFARSAGGTPDFRTVSALISELETRELVLGAIVIVTHAGPPGEDSFHSVNVLAAKLAHARRGPVVFMCHGPGYESYYAEDANPTFPALLLDSLSREDHGLEQSFWYARDRVHLLADADQQIAFGVPGCYVPEPAIPSSGMTLSPGLGTGKSRQKDES